MIFLVGNYIYNNTSQLKTLFQRLKSYRGLLNSLFKSKFCSYSWALKWGKSAALNSMVLAFEQGRLDVNCNYANNNTSILGIWSNPGLSISFNRQSSLYNYCIANVTLKTRLCLSKENITRNWSSQVISQRGKDQEWKWQNTIQTFNS